MEPIWDELYRAALAALKPRQVSRFIEAGGVAAARMAMPYPPAARAGS